MRRTMAMAAAVAITVTGMGAAQSANLTAWAPQPVTPAPFTGPNKPVKRYADILARHKGRSDWTETEVLTRDFLGQYVSMAPGTSTKTLFWADDRVYWVVTQGKMRVTIDGVEPFIASRGFLVQVPYRVPYRIEAVGDEPVIRFEVLPAGEVPSYPVSDAPDAAPPSIKGIKFVQASYSGRGAYDGVNKPFIDFEKDIVAANGKGGGAVKDDHTWANIIRSPGIPTPPATSLGHFHENFAEFWLVMEGKEDFLIEGEPLITAGFGDIVFAPDQRWHRATAAAGGYGTRLAITPRPPSLHYYQPGGGGD